MRSSIPLYDALAADYDAHFAVPHRRAYDALAWDFVEPMLPAAPGCVIDAGCGNGRWAERLAALGHQVIGIEQAPAMAAAARARMGGRRFRLVEGSMETAELPEGAADLTLALGSLQYTSDPERVIGRLASWTRVGGFVVVLVDSLVALVAELLASGRSVEALRSLRTGMGRWVEGDHCADNHQLHRDRLLAAFAAAGLAEVRVRGLLVGWSVFGRMRFLAQLAADRDRQLRCERSLAEQPVLADLGKQLLVSGRRER